MSEEFYTDYRWIDDIAEENSKRSEAAATAELLRAALYRKFNALIDDFFHDIRTDLERAIDAYKGRFPRISISSYFQPPSRFVIHKPVYPAGDAVIELDKAGMRLRCSYDYSTFAGSSHHSLIIMHIETGEHQLYLRRSDEIGSEIFRGQVANEVLAHYFRKISGH